MDRKKKKIKRMKSNNINRKLTSSKTKKIKIKTRIRIKTKKRIKNKNQIKSRDTKI